MFLEVVFFISVTLAYFDIIGVVQSCIGGLLLNFVVAICLLGQLLCENSVEDWQRELKGKVSFLFKKQVNFSNNLHTFVKALQHDTTLKELKVSCLDVCKDDPSSDARLLATALKKHPALQVLDLSNNGIDSRDATCISAVLEMPSLRKLIFDNNNVESPGVKDLAQALDKTTTLTHLGLHSNNIDSDGAKALGNALKINSTLKVLNLSGNYIEYSGVKVLCEALLENSSLQELNLSDNKIDCTGAEALATSLRTNSTLLTLGLSNNCIKSRGAVELSHALVANTTLQKLDLGKNSIGFKAIQSCFEALAVNSALKALGLSSNAGNAEDLQEDLANAAVSLGEALTQNTTLMELYLVDIHFSSQWLSHLGEALMTNQTLQKLNLSYNQISSEGAESISEALQSNSSLKELDLSHNQISSEGAESISEALQSNSSLKELDLSHNMICCRGARALAEALEDNSSLLTVNLLFNKIGISGATSLTQALRLNSTLRELKVLHRFSDAEELGESIRVNSLGQDADCGTIHFLHSTLQRALHRNALILQHFEEKSFSSNKRDFVRQQLRRNHFLSMIDDASLSTIISSLSAKFSETTRPVPPFPVLLQNRVPILESLEPIASLRCRWTEVQGHSPFLEAAFISSFSRFSTAVCSRLRIPSVNQELLNYLQDVSSSDPLLEKLLDHLPVMKEFEEWLQSHKECHIISQHVKKLNHRIRQETESLGMKSSTGSSENNKDDTAGKQHEISALRESLSDCIDVLWSEYPAQIRASHLQELAPIRDKYESRHNFTGGGVSGEVTEGFFSLPSGSGDD